MNKTNKYYRTYRMLSLGFFIVLSLGLTITAMAHIWTDPLDYSPGSTVTIEGENSDLDNERNWIPGETLQVDVVGPNSYASECVNADTGLDPVVDASGYWSCQVTLWSGPEAIGTYTYTAVGSQSTESGQFTDANQSANLDQCANDKYPSDHTDGCDANASQWVNGNLGASKSGYFENDFISYRMRFGDVTTGTENPHTVIIEWDTTKGGKHAIDYLTTFNRTVATANPCLGVTGCDPFSYNPFAIPADPQVTGAGVTPVSGEFRLYGGTITGVSVYSYPDGPGFDGDKSARITITFTADVATPVLAWGGKIADRKDWPGNSAIYL